MAQKQTNGSSKDPKIADQDTKRSDAGNTGRSGHRDSKSPGRKFSNSGRGKGKKPGGSKETEVDIKDSAINMEDLSARGLRDGSSGKNDIRFWNKFPGLFDPATRIQRRTQVGADFELGSGSSVVSNSATPVVPGIMILRFAPTIGVCKQSSDPVNQLLTSSYAWYRNHYRAASRYEPVDIGLYNIGIASAASVWCEFSRVIGLVKAAKQDNLYFARDIVNALGYDFENLNANLADAQQMINTLASELRRWSLPADLAVVSRWAQLSSNVYKDSDSPTAQIYVWQMDGYYQYVEGNVSATPPTVGYLKYVKFNQRLAATPQLVAGTAKMTLDDMAEIANTLMLPFFGSSALAQIAADTAQALDYAGLMKYPDLAADFVIEPKYEPEEQAQIENSLFVGNVTPSDITQAVVSPNANQPNYLIQTVSTVFPEGSTVAPFFLEHGKFINYHDDKNTADDVMINTRMMPTGKVSVTGTDVRITLSSYGTEIPTLFYLVTKSNLITTSAPTGLNAVQIGFTSAFALNPGVSSELDVQINNYSLLTTLISAFDWHPQVYVYGMKLGYASGVLPWFGGSSDQLQFLRALLDFDEYSTINDSELRQLHTAAVMSAFFIDKVTYYNPQ